MEKKLLRFEQHENNDVELEIKEMSKVEIMAAIMMIMMKANINPAMFIEVMLGVMISNAIPSEDDYRKFEEELKKILKETLENNSKS